MRFKDTSNSVLQVVLRSVKAGTFYLNLASISFLLEFAFLYKDLNCVQVIEIKQFFFTKRLKIVQTFSKPKQLTVKQN